jgi:hypothetical protein
MIDNRGRCLRCLEKAEVVQVGTILVIYHLSSYTDTDACQPVLYMVSNDVGVLTPKVLAKYIY